MQAKEAHIAHRGLPTINAVICTPLRMGKIPQRKLIHRTVVQAETETSLLDCKSSC
jgi:hypothetical protein